LENQRDRERTEAAVVFFIYRRPDLTALVFEEIRRYRPKKLYLIADGARSTQEVNDVFLTRECVKDVDWECEVTRIYQDKNRGLRESVIRGLDLVFDKEESAIILEDDCLPNPSFFSFCNSLIARYENDSRLSMISGFSDGAISKVSNGYFFSSMPEIWGWATWSRVWKEYRSSEIARKWSPEQRRRITKSLGRLTRGRLFARLMKDNIVLNTWDVEFAAHLILEGKLTAVPKVNLIKNIGFGGSATHTTIRPPGLKNSLGYFTFPISHPKKIDSDRLRNVRDTAVKSARTILEVLLNPPHLLNYFSIVIRNKRNDYRGTGAKYSD
jgi:hypothetical protein